MPVAKIPGIRAGKLNRRVTLQQGTPSSGTEGDAILTWVSLGDYWATIAPASTADLLLAAQRGEQISHMITLRYQADFPAPQDLRLMYQGRIFNILGATDPDEGHISLSLRCSEYVGSAGGT